MKLDDYELEKLISKDTFGEIYLTKKEGDSQKYATRKIDRKEADNNEEIKIFVKNEIMFLKNLDHPNIVKFKDVKKSKLNYYTIMEWCNGGTLSEALKIYMEKNGKAFPEELVQYFMRQIIDAFKYIHGKKIIHRNIMLENILLHFDNEEDKKNFNLMKGQIKISDFRFSCICNQLKTSLVGTPINFHPFFLRKLNSLSNKTKKLGYDQNYDIWSIGEICYDMLFGKYPFDAENMEDNYTLLEMGNYTVPTNISAESISFLNGMLIFEEKKRLTAEQLFEHAFLNKDIKQFTKININQLANKIKDNKIILNIYESNSFIDNITGNQIMDIINQKEEESLKENVNTPDNQGK